MHTVVYSSNRRRPLRVERRRLAPRRSDTNAALAAVEICYPSGSNWQSKATIGANAV